MPTLVAFAVIATSLAAQVVAQDRVHPEPTASGAVALSARRVEAVPSEGRFGQSNGWIVSAEHPVQFEAFARGAGVEVVASFVMPGYHHEYVRLVLDPSGAVWDAGGRVRSAESLHDGLREGDRHAWYEGGGVQSIEEYRAGLAHGRRVVFHPDGQKELEMSYELGGSVGNRRRWDDKGALIEDVPAKELPWRRTSEERHTRFPEDLAAFHTRLER